MSRQETIIKDIQFQNLNIKLKITIKKMKRNEKNYISFEIDVLLVTPTPLTSTTGSPSSTASFHTLEEVIDLFKQSQLPRITNFPQNNA